MAAGLTAGLASCDELGGGDEETGDVTVTIDNLSGTGAMQVYSSKPVQWNGLDESPTLAWGTLSNYLPAAPLYGGTAGDGLPQLYTGGEGYLCVTMAAEGPHNTFVSKQKVSLRAGNNRFDLTTDFEILHEYNGPGTLTVTNMHPAVDYISNLDVYSGPPSEDTWVAGMGASGVVGHHRDFDALPLFDFDGNRYTATRNTLLVMMNIGFDGEPHDDFVYWRDNQKFFYNAWWVGQINFNNGRAEIDWSSFEIVPE